MKTLPLFLAISLLIGMISGCTKDANNLTENIYVNERFPDSSEKFHPDSMRVFTFESYFKNWVTVSKQDQILAEGYIETYSNGSAGRFLVKAQSRDRITIRAAKEQASFRLKDGYKYLYINKLNTNKWTVTTLFRIYNPKAIC
ncbi:hypothetical protein [Siphonobacter sp. SORGH_AS_1065]|uniref:hypothetical protein n=1 Tax=Siphonobacter sp. SORGH_AS_1065 TaxID=3041795 RepID=UPI0027D8477D|nr:hypothetical protein [Siphonobacter sp. SORGH_AS_1065]